MIQVRELKKSFDGFEALRGLTLTVPKGAVYGLVGPNGAGKSTLIRHLAGIYRQDGGEVLVGGEPVYAELADISWTEGQPGGARTFNREDIPAGSAFADDEGNSCTVIKYGQVGSQTVISLSLKGETVYPELSVQMDGSDHGSFVTAEGDGEIWFSEDEIVIDAYLPDFNVADTMFLPIT